MNCINCNLHKTRTKMVLGKGSESPDILILGEAPGREEDTTGTPFVGKAGLLLDFITAHSDVSQYKVRYDNIVKCRPVATGEYGYINRTPTEHEINSCFPILEKDIALLKPKVIITLGKVPTSIILNQKSRSFTIGNIRSTKHFYKNIPVIPSWHPSGILRRGYKDGVEETISDLNYAVNIIKGVNENIYPFLIDTKDKFNNIISALHNADTFSADIETSKKGEIIGISFSWVEDYGVYVPFLVYDGLSLQKYWQEDNTSVIYKITKLITDKYSNIVYHNAPFDTLEMYKHWGIPIGECIDTMLMWGAVEDTRMSGNRAIRKLDYLADRFFPWVKGYKKEVTDRFSSSDDIDFGKIPLDIMYKYGATDAIVTLKLYNLFTKMLQES